MTLAKSPPEIVTQLQIEQLHEQPNVNAHLAQLFAEQLLSTARWQMLIAQQTCSCT